MLPIKGQKESPNQQQILSAASNHSGAAAHRSLPRQAGPPSHHSVPSYPLFVQIHAKAWLFGNCHIAIFLLEALASELVAQGGFFLGHILHDERIWNRVQKVKGGGNV